MQKIASLLMALSLAMCFQTASAAQLINGAGATFPYPIYSKWFHEYNKQNPSVQINYQSIGSGAGIKQLIAKTVDFGASDAPMTDEELSQVLQPVFHIPTVLGAVVLSYNIPNVTKALNMTPEVISGIYLGNIKKWNDAAIAKVNPGVELPDLYITPVYRSDGSGTTAVFTDYLNKVSHDWSTKVGQGKSVKWPAGLGGKGNEGVSGVIKQTPGAVGYVEQVYAVTNHLPMASVQNASGKFIVPSFDSVTAAAAGAVENMPDDFRISITNATGEKSYPISSFTYLLVYKKMPKKVGKDFVGFLKWSMTTGQAFAKNLAYAPLPPPIIKKVEKKISQVEFE